MHSLPDSAIYRHLTYLGEDNGRNITAAYMPNDTLFLVRRSTSAPFRSQPLDVPLDDVNAFIQRAKDYGLLTGGQAAEDHHSQIKQLAISDAGSLFFAQKGGLSYVTGPDFSHIDHEWPIEGLVVLAFEDFGGLAAATFQKYDSSDPAVRVAKFQEMHPHLIELLGEPVFEHLTRPLRRPSRSQGGVKIRPDMYPTGQPGAATQKWLI